MFGGNNLKRQRLRRQREKQREKKKSNRAKVRKKRHEEKLNFMAQDSKPSSTAEEGSDSFIPAPTFEGAKEGFAFKLGPHGTGYYKLDSGYHKLDSVQGVSSRKRKRLDQIKAAQDRKEKREELYRSLQKTALTMQEQALMSSSGALGQTLTLKNAMKRDLKMQRAGLGNLVDQSTSRLKLKNPLAVGRIAPRPHGLSSSSDSNSDSDSGSEVRV